MIKNFHKKVISGEMDKELIDKSRNLKQLRKSTDCKADYPQTEETKMSQALETEVEFSD